MSAGACLNPTAEVWGVPKPSGALSCQGEAVTVPEQQEWVCSVQFPAGQALAFGIGSVPTGALERLLRLFFTPLVVVAGALGRITWCEEPVPLLRSSSLMHESSGDFGPCPAPAWVPWMLLKMILLSFLKIRP